MKPEEMEPAEMFNQAVKSAIEFLKVIEATYDQPGTTSIIIDTNGATLYHAGMRAFYSDKEVN